MPYCPKCGKETPEDAVFCPSCGTKLITKQEVATSETIFPSGLVYLFGDLFAPRAKLGGFQVPCANEKVKHTKLATVMLVATFLSLSKDDLINVFLGEKRGFLGRRTIDAYVSVKADFPHKGLGYLKREVYAEIKRNEAPLVYDVVRSIIGSDSYDPWAAIISRVENKLVKQGILAKSVKKGRLRTKVKLIPNCQEIAKYREAALKLKSTIDGWRLKEPEVYKKLEDRIASAFNSRQIRETDIGPEYW